MTDVIKYEEVESKIISIREQQVILDSDVAELYGVSTKEVNQAVNRNLDKFPAEYIIELNKAEKNELVTNCDRFTNLKHSTTNPKAFSEKGLYMLATILKSSKATETTLAIIDTFAKLRELNRSIALLQKLPEESKQQKTLLQKTGEIMADLFIPYEENELGIDESETTIEIGFPFMKIKKRVKKSKK